MRKYVQRFVHISPRNVVKQCKHLYSNGTKPDCVMDWKGKVYLLYWPETDLC